MPEAARVLIVAHRTAGSPELLEAVRDRARQGSARFHLVVPATPYGLKRLMGGESDDRSEAQGALELALPALSEAAGHRVTGEVGDAEPLAAVQDAVNLARYDEIIVSTLPARLSRWMKLDLVSKVRNLGLPVTHVVGREAWAGAPPPAMLAVAPVEAPAPPPAPGDAGTASGVAEILLVAHRTAGSETLLEAVRERARRGPARFHLVLPATPHGLQRATDPEDADRSEAQAALEIALPALSGAAGARVTGSLGDPNPLAAIEDAVNLGSFDEIIVSTLPARLSRWMKLDLVSKARGLGLPVTHVVGRVPDEVSVAAKRLAARG